MYDYSRLLDAGISYEDARALRRIAMALHRWYEGECGIGNGHIERDDNDHPYWANDASRCFAPNDPSRKTRIPDRERGAYKRLYAVMRRYPLLDFYLQTDPRGASLYILRPGDIPKGERASSRYTRGIAVYK